MAIAELFSTEVMVTFDQVVHLLKDSIIYKKNQISVV